MVIGRIRLDFSIRQCGASRSPKWMIVLPQCGSVRMAGWVLVMQREQSAQAEFCCQFGKLACTPRGLGGEGGSIIELLFGLWLAKRLIDVPEPERWGTRIKEKMEMEKENKPKWSIDALELDERNFKLLHTFASTAKGQPEAYCGKRREIGRRYNSAGQLSGCPWV